MNKELRIKLESFYKDYNNNLRPLLILLETENDKNLIWSTTHQKRRFWGSTLLAFIISLVTGFIIGIIVFVITSLFGIDILDIFGIVV